MNTETNTVSADTPITDAKQAKARVRQSSKNVPQHVKDAVMTRVMGDGDLATALILAGTNVGAKTRVYLDSVEMAAHLADAERGAIRATHRQLSSKINRMAKDLDPYQVAKVLVDHAASLVTASEMTTLTGMFRADAAWFPPID